MSRTVKFYTDPNHCGHRRATQRTIHRQVKSLKSSNRMYLKSYIIYELNVVINSY